MQEQTRWLKMYLKLLIRISLLFAFSSLARVRMRAEPVELALAAR